MSTTITAIESEAAAIKRTLLRPEGYAIADLARSRVDLALRLDRIESHEYEEHYLAEARDLLIEDRRSSGDAWAAFREEWTRMVLAA